MPMNRPQADAYVHWTYEDPYSFYTIPEEGREETFSEIFSDPAKYYFSVLKYTKLFGIFEYEQSQSGLEIGLGICPDETGKGEGRRFVANCIAFGRKHFNDKGTVCLDVAEFNSRAIHLYRQLGFTETGKVSRLSFGKPVCFIRMETKRVDFELTYTEGQPWNGFH